jgi:uncharacterized protein YbjT (DUF2867 family)
MSSGQMRRWLSQRSPTEPLWKGRSEGIKRVFVVSGHNPQTAEQQTNTLEAGKSAGVAFFAKVSGGKAVVGPDAESIVGRAHHAVEEAIKKSGLAWIILRPGLFMQTRSRRRH